MNTKTIQKLGLTTGLLITATLAHADQCQLIPVEQASKALNHLKPESQFVNFCEPCGDKDFHKKEVQTVESITVNKDEVGGHTYWEISLNGKGIDLAYTFPAHCRRLLSEYVQAGRLSVTECFCWFCCTRKVINRHVH